jgi:PTH2 family peptidyl-tRNA hydrolase
MTETEHVDKGVKQVIVMRHDLNMRLGKKIAQGAHASGAWMSHFIQNIGVASSGSRSQLMRNLIQNELLSPEQEAWIYGNFKKICVRVDSEQELLDIYNKAKEKGLEAYLICDNGLTEFHGVPTNTCCAIGPNFDVAIYEITGHLKLL